MDLGGTLVVYFAGASGFLLILGLSYLYRKIVHNPYHLNLTTFTNDIDPNQQQLHTITDISFPVTLELMDRVAMMDEHTLQFLSPCSIQANYQYQPTTPAYFEIKIIDLPHPTSLYIGVAPKTYGIDCTPGKVPNSVGVEISLRHRRPTFRSQDTIGLLYYPPHPLTITHNGITKGTLPLPHHSTLHPTLYATGPTRITVNLGQSNFLFPPANLNSLGLIPRSASLVSPPQYPSPTDRLPNYTRWTEPKLNDQNHP